MERWGYNTGMNIPKFWAKAEEAVDGPAGRIPLRCWGWAHSGMEEAKSNARMALLRLADRVRNGAPFPERYAYANRALREEIIREIPAADGSAPAGVITRNSYGSLVLNTSQTLFVDVDVTPPRDSGGGWFWKKKPAENTEALNSLRERAERLGGAFRIYRTAAGFRLLGLDRCYEAGSNESVEIMTSLNADPKYVQLCRAQKSFRARLTPKPWRCGCKTPPSAWPRESSQNAAFEKWLNQYDNVASSYAICSLVAETGTGGIHDSVKPVALWHDEFTRPGSNLPLA